MKKLLSILVILISGSLTAFALLQPQIPTRAFDVRNGNGVVDAGTTYPQATVIVFKDKAAKDGIIDAFAAQYGYQATVPNPANPNGEQIPNPQNKQAFMNAKITAYLRDIYRASKITAAADAAKKTAEAAADSDLPPNQ